MSALNKFKKPYLALFLLVLVLAPVFLVTKYAASARTPLSTNRLLSQKECDLYSAASWHSLHTLLREIQVPGQEPTKIMQDTAF